MIRHVLASFLFSLILLSNLRLAIADVPPIDACRGEGTACTVVGNTGGFSGTCEKSTCTRPGPNPNGTGTITITYECLRCRPGGGSGGSSGGSAGTGGAGGIVEPPATGGSAGFAGSEAGGSSGCDCRIGQFRSEYALVLVMVASGLYLARRARRQP